MEKWDSVSKFGYVKSSTQWVAHQQHTSIEPLTRPQRKCRRNIASSANHAKRPGFDRYFGLNVVQMISMFHRCLQLSVADLFWAGHLVHDCNISPSFPDPGPQSSSLQDPSHAAPESFESALSTCRSQPHAARVEQNSGRWSNQPGPPIGV